MHPVREFPARRIELAPSPARIAAAPHRSWRRAAARGWQWLGAGMVAAAVLVQFAVLGGATPASALGGTGAAAAGAALWTRRRRWPRAAGVVCATVLGGAAMLAGAWLAARMGTPAAGHAHSHGHDASAAAGVAAVLWSPATPMMLLACAAAMRASGAAPCAEGRIRSVLVHSLCAASMVCGMAAGAWLLGPRLSGWMDAAAGMHLAMLLGMAGGSGLVLVAFGHGGRT